MTSTDQSKAPVGDRVRLPLSFDVEKMQADVRALALEDFIYYSVIMLTAPGAKDDGTTPSGPIDYADGSWANWIDTGALKACPYLTSVVESFREHTNVTLVRLLRLQPGSEIKEHTDPTLGLEVEKSVIRLTVPIVTNKDAALYLNSEPVPMQPGECWYLRFSDPHRAVNFGPAERIHMSIDMTPNEWVRALIEDAAP